MINELGKKVNEHEIKKGFECSEEKIPVKLALIHSEVSEALEADRRNNYFDSNIDVMNGWVSDEDFKSEFEEKLKGTFEDELVDILLRVIGLAAWKGIDLEKHAAAKMRYNSLRPHKHGGKKY